MRPTLLFLLQLSLSSLCAQENDITKALSDIVEAERNRHEHLLDFSTNPLTTDYDIRYHRLEWTVDPAVAFIEGRVTTWFVPVVDEFDQLHFDLSANMTVHQVLYQGTPISFILLPEDVLQINLPLSLNQGQLDSVTVIYSGAPLSTGFGSFVASPHNGTPVMWTLSEPYGAKNWWPCKQDLNDKIDSIDVWITTPDSYRAASNGLLKETIESDETTIHHWKHKYPIAAYLVAFAVTDYASYSDYVPLSNGDTVEVLNYVYPEFLATAQSQTSAIVEIMQLFSDLFTPYPFANEKYGHAQCGFGGGMEHQTMSFMGNFGFELQAHELAHQWFGDYVTCGSWEDIWLNEGFATYLSGLCYEHIQPQFWLTFKKVRLQNITSQPGGSVWVNDTTSVSRIFSQRLSYAKGAMVLHMLRWVIGDEDFFQGLRNYLLDPDLAFSYARTADLRAHLEAQSGIDLDEFFNQWIYGEGFPSYQVRWWPIMDGIHIKLDQTTSLPGLPFFALPVPIQVVGPGVDTMLRLDHSYSGQGFDILLPFSVDSLVFDPELWLISAYNFVEMLVSKEPHSSTKDQITMSPNPVAELLTIHLPEPETDAWKVVCYNSLGQVIYQTKHGGGNALISTAPWPAGTYTIIFEDGHARVSKHVIHW